MLVPPPRDTRDTPPPELLRALRSAHESGARIASICTGAFLLAAAGLLDGRRATVHWNDADDLARRHPAVAVDRSVLYIDDGDILTSAGSAAGLDLCLHLVRSDHGARVANVLARHVVVSRTARAGRPSTSTRRSRPSPRVASARRSPGRAPTWTGRSPSTSGPGRPR